MTIKNQKFKEKKHFRNNEDKSSLIIRNADKCILCGLCVRVCEEREGVTALGLIGRGFDTIVNPELSLPLDLSSCTFCGACVDVCPTGALKEKQPIKKQLAVEEESRKSVCELCDKLCPIDIRYIGNTVTRIKPGDKNTLLCKKGKFDLTDKLNGAQK